MLTTDQAPRPASRALAAEVTKKVRERGLIVWVDAERQYTSLVEALRGGAFGFTYPVVAFHGSYLELMLALEPYGNGLLPEHVLVHLPGLSKDTVKETPVFELYKAGITFEKNLGTLVREAAMGAARPEEVEAFVRAPGLSLDKADGWIGGLHAEPKEGLTLLLESRGLEDVAMGLLTDDPRLRAHLPEGGEQLFAFLEKGLGLSASFRRFIIGEAEPSASALGTLLASFLMAVEFVHDLNEAPVMPELEALRRLGSLTPPVLKECRRLLARFREQHPDAYELFANELQERIEQERTSHHAGALGAIDTFRFEEATTRAAALGALCRSEWEAAVALAEERTPEKCFWVRRSPKLQRTWEIMRQAASAGRTLAATGKGLDRCGSLDEAVERYAEKLAPVDRQHRLFEQRAHGLIASDLDDYDALLEVRKAVREAHREWSNAINRAFFALCVEHGPLPARSLRQRAVYEEVVHPLVEQGKRVAFVLVDALRFEMAQGLAEELRREKYRASLHARLAELPSETAVGMNALAPVERNGRLRPVWKSGKIAGFTAGEFSVSSPADRVRAISQRSLTGTAEDIELEELQDLTVTQLKRRLSSKPLVVVRSRELDTAGEHGLHLGTFDHTLALLKSAISLLSQAGVATFVIAADHGFLLQDATTENIPFGVSKRVPERRYALLPEPSGMADVLEVRLSALEYEVEQDQILVLRPDTALWETSRKIAPFVHGGNSLQERVIPVLVLDRQIARGKTTSRYEVVARAEPSHLGRQRLRVAVRLQNRENASLGFLSPKSITLALRVPGRPEVIIGLLDAEPPARLADGRVLVPPNREEALVEFEIEAPFDEKVRVEVYHPDAAEEVTPKVVEGFFDAARSRHLPKLRGEKGSAPPSPSPASERASASPAMETPVESVPAPPAPAPPAPAPPAPAPPAPAKPVAAKPAPAEPSYLALIADASYRRAIAILEERRSINEDELIEVLGSSRRVRAFARHYDDLVRLLPFEVEVRTVSGMKTYARKD